VEQVFTEVFGETGRAFIFNSRRRKGLEKERIPEEIEKFSEEPVGMLGSGGLMLLNRILDKLTADLGAKTPRDAHLGFEE